MRPADRALLDADVAELMGLDVEVPQRVDAGWDLGALHAGCDHKPGTPEHAEWMRAQARSEAGVRRSAGRTHADTMAMRDQAARDFGEPGRIVGAEGTALAATAAHVSTAVGDLAVELFEYLKAALEDFKQAVLSVDLSSLGEPNRRSIYGHHANFSIIDEAFHYPSDAEVQAVRAVQRKRHGRAASCPKHGPTKGGLCRRCNR